MSITPSRLPRWNYPSLSAGKGSVCIERQDGEEETTFIIREGNNSLVYSKYSEYPLSM